MNDERLRNIVDATATIATWFTQDQTDETYQSVLNGGAEALADFALDCAEANGIEYEHADVDFEIAYLIIRDWNALELWRTLSEAVVCEYMGIDRADDEWKPSASLKAKNFGASSLSEVSARTGIPLRTLNDWFAYRKIAFHASLEFSTKYSAANND